MFILSLLLLVGVIPSNATNERLCIVSSPDLIQCNNLEIPHGIACVMLSSFAANTSKFLDNRNGIGLGLILIFCSGNHTLHSKLIIAHINQLWIYSNTSRSLDMNIVCVDHAARFEFTNITHIHISTSSS